jgi:hypothetical protein
VHVQFEVDSPMVEEIRGLAVPATGCASAWHNVGDGDGGGGSLFQSSLPVGWGWWCVVLGVFVLFRVCSCGGVSLGSLRIIVSS